MKLQIDTDNKVIKLESNIKFSELVEKLDKLFPNSEWKEYTLETNVGIYWTNPIVIKDWYTYNPYPWVTPMYTSSDLEVGTTATYCVEY